MSEKVQMVNVIMDAVEAVIDDAMSGFDMCTCEKCRLDVMAITLNNLPPKYVVSQMGFAFAFHDCVLGQSMTDIYKEIYKAATLVRANPKH